MFSDALPGFVNAGSPRVRMGLGTIARIVASGEEIYAEKLRFAEARRRIECLYLPYHQALGRLVEETEGVFGGCLLVDCHSMPSAAGYVCGRDGADIVLGDCHGASCASQIVEAATGFLVERGFVVAINAPYAGGFTTGFYGRPSAHRHALQIEISRALYMGERNYGEVSLRASGERHGRPRRRRLHHAGVPPRTLEDPFAVIDPPPSVHAERDGSRVGRGARNVDVGTRRDVYCGIRSAELARVQREERDLAAAL
jgi:N-formylglutamate amidohydrolase